MDKIQKTIKSKRIKHLFFLVLIGLLVFWVVFRFAAVASENARYVFNASRVMAESGAPIEALVVSEQDGVLYEPLVVKNNRAYVSGDRVSKLHTGWKIGDGTIKSVSKKIDLDTGMYVVRTNGVPDGLHYAEFVARGFFVPLYAISDNTVLVSQDGVATVRKVIVSRQDSENAYITDGLQDGDIVILSKVNAGDKVKYNKK